MLVGRGESSAVVTAFPSFGTCRSYPCGPDRTNQRTGPCLTAHRNRRPRNHCSWTCLCPCLCPLAHHHTCSCLFPFPWRQSHLHTFPWNSFLCLPPLPAAVSGFKGRLHLCNLPTKLCSLLMRHLCAQGFLMEFTSAAFLGGFKFCALLVAFAVGRRWPTAPRTFAPDAQAAFPSPPAFAGTACSYSQTRARQLPVAAAAA